MIKREKARHAIKRVSLMDLIRMAGLTQGLQVCLDVGDLKSYSGGALWKDLSGNGNDYVMTGSAADRPLFIGTPGRGSELDFWTGSSGTVGFIPNNTPTWDDNIHKNNGVFSCVTCAFLRIGSNNGLNILSNGDSTSASLNNGISLQLVANNNNFNFRYDTDNTASSGTVNTSETPLTTGELRFLGVSFDESANIIMKNGQLQQPTTTASTASTNTTNPGFAPAIMCRGDISAGTDGLGDVAFYNIAIWTRALTSNDLNTLGELIKLYRFPGIR